MANGSRKVSRTWLGVFTAGLLASGSVALSSPAHAARLTTGAPEPTLSSAMGAFLESGPTGVSRIGQLERWLGGRELRVGHTYLPGDLWSNIEGPRGSWTPGPTGATSGRTGCSS